jgi:putative DNA primase/helicase
MLALADPAIVDLRIVGGGLTQFSGSVYTSAERGLDGVGTIVAEKVRDKLQEAEVAYKMFERDDESEAAKAAEAVWKGWKRALERIHSAAGQRGMNEILRASITVSIVPDAVRDGRSIPTDAGLYDLQTGDVQPYQSDEVITRYCSDFHLGGPSSLLDELLKYLWPDPLEREFAQRVFGLSLLRGLQRFIAVIGPKRSGKSALIEAVQTVLGELAVEGDREILLTGGNPHGASWLALRGRRLAIFSEIAQGRLAADRIKSISGGDVLTTRFLYSSEIIQFRYQGVLLMSGNEMPIIGDSTGGLAARIVYLPTRGASRPSESWIPMFGESIARQERGAVLAWLIEGARQFIANGLQTPASIASELNDIVANDDPVQVFLSESYDWDGQSSEPAQSLYLKYVSWAALHGEQRPLSANALGRRLTAMGLKAYRTPTHRRWLGLKSREGMPGMGLVVPMAAAS